MASLLTECSVVLTAYCDRVLWPDSVRTGDISSRFAVYYGYTVWTRYGLDGPGLESRSGRNFPYPPIPTLGPKQLPVQWVTGIDKAAGAWRWAPTLYSAEVEKRVELYLYSPLELHGMFRSNFTFIRYQPEETMRLVDRFRLMIHRVSGNRLYVLRVGSIDKRLQDNRSSVLRWIWSSVQSWEETVQKWFIVQMKVAVDCSNVRSVGLSLLKRRTPT